MQRYRKENEKTNSFTLTTTTMDAERAIEVLKSNYLDSRNAELRRAVEFAIAILEKGKEKKDK